MSQLREGDLLLFNTLDGGNISVVNGEPVMDGGFQSAMYLSLYGHDDTPYWGNEYLEEAQKLKSEFFSFIKGAEKTTENILKAEAFAKKDLQWFLDQTIADEINVDITSPNRNNILITIEILADGETLASNEFEINWGFEEKDPADERV